MTITQAPEPTEQTTTTDTYSVTIGDMRLTFTVPAQPPEVIVPDWLPAEWDEEPCVAI